MAQLLNLFAWRKDRMPYAAIGEALGKTDLACRLSYHNHREEREAQEAQEAQERRTQSDFGTNGGPVQHQGCVPGPQRAASFPCGHSCYCAGPQRSLPPLASSSQVRPEQRRLLPAPRREQTTQVAPHINSTSATALPPLTTALAGVAGVTGFDWNNVANHMGTISQNAYGAYQQLQHYESEQRDAALRQATRYVLPHGSDNQDYSLLTGDNSGLEQLSMAAALMSEEQTVSPRTKGPPAQQFADFEQVVNRAPQQSTERAVTGLMLQRPFVPETQMETSQQSSASDADKAKHQNERRDTAGANRMSINAVLSDS